MAMEINGRNNSSPNYYVDDDEYDGLISEHQQHQSWSANILGNICCLQTFSLEGDATTVLEGSAFDVIVVESEDGRLFQNSDFLVSFQGENENNDGGDDETYKIVMEVSQHTDNTKAWFPIIRQASSTATSESNDNNNNCKGDTNALDDERFWGCCHPGSAKPGTLSKFSDGTIGNNNDDPLSALKGFLQPGRNAIRYLLLDDQRIVGIAHAYIYLWKHSDSIVVSDIDGTITKSNARGVLGTIVTKQYDRVCHEGICRMLSRLSMFSQVVYVTSRPLSLANQTREFLSTLKQGDETLPVGPLLGFGGKFPQLLLMELVSKTTQRFKAGKLWQQVIQPFRQANNNNSTSPVFVAGFGNNFMDMQSYHAIGMDLNQIFKINKKSQIVTFDRGTGVSNSSNGEFSFPPHQWYKDRIGSQFDGYTDPKLIERLFPA